METVKLKFDTQGHGAFFIIDKEGTPLAKLIVDIIESDLIVTGTEALKGKRRLASQLFTALISYAREHYLKVIAFNAFVYDKLTQDPERFADVWDENRTYKE